MKVTISEGNAREGEKKGKAERTDATRNEAGEKGSSDGEGDEPPTDLSSKNKRKQTRNQAGEARGEGQRNEEERRGGEEGRRTARRQRGGGEGGGRGQGGAAREGEEGRAGDRKPQGIWPPRTPAPRRKQRHCPTRPTPTRARSPARTLRGSVPVRSSRASPAARKRTADKSLWESRRSLRASLGAAGTDAMRSRRSIGSEGSASVSFPF